MNGHLKGILIALFGVIILSPDSLCVRLLAMEQWSIQFYRGSGLAVSLFMVMALLYGRQTPARVRAIGWPGVAAAFCFSGSSICFVAGLYLTSVANTLAIISTTPIFGAILSRLALKERLPVQTWVAAVLVTGCIGIIVSGDLRSHGGSVSGDLAALSASLFMATSFVLVRSRKEVNMVPCMAVSGLITACVSLILSPAFLVDASNVPLLVLLCFVILPISFGLLIMAPRYISAPEVNMIMLMEMILGPILVWMVIREPAPSATLLGGGLLFAILLSHSLMAVIKNRPLSQTTAL